MDRLRYACGDDVRTCCGESCVNSYQETLTRGDSPTFQVVPLVGLSNVMSEATAMAGVLNKKRTRAKSGDGVSMVNGV